MNREINGDTLDGLLTLSELEREVEAAPAHGKSENPERDPEREVNGVVYIGADMCDSAVKNDAVGDADVGRSAAADAAEEDGRDISVAVETDVEEGEICSRERGISDMSERPAETAQTVEAEAPPRGRLIVMLICTVLAAIAVIVYGVMAADALAGIRVPVSELLLGEVIGGDVAAVNGTYLRQPLKRIPPREVSEGESPGAAEDETAAEESIPPSGTRLPVREVDLSVDAHDVLAVINETPYSPDVAALLESPSAIPPLSVLQERYGASAPVVLILHTHGTESYLADGAVDHDSAESFRSYDTDQNVVAVGRAMAEVLRRHGIGVIHLETMFDAEDYNSAYYLAAGEIKRIISEYPSISYVLDVHRDAMITPDGVNLKPTSPILTEWGAPSQIMLVVGTDHGGSGHTGWERNLALAARLQSEALGLNGRLMRPLNLRSASFNEQYTTGSLLVEVGAAGSSLGEALAAGRLFAEATARVIKGE